MPPLSFSSLLSNPHHPFPPGPSLALPYLTVGLTGREQGLECGSKPNDIEEAGWHEALKSHQHGILAGKKRIFRIGKKLLLLPPHTSMIIPAQKLPPNGPFAPLSAPNISFSPRSRNLLMPTSGWTKAIIIEFLIRVASLTSQSHSAMACQFHFTSR